MNLFYVYIDKYITRSHVSRFRNVRINIHNGFESKVINKDISFHDFFFKETPSKKASFALFSVLSCCAAAKAG